MGIEISGGIPAVRRREFCDRFDLDRAKDFYGFRVNGVGFHYRLGSIVPVKTKGKKYTRVEWREPLGRQRALMQFFSFVLFHVPKKPTTTEVFYVKSVKELDAMIRKFPILEKTINIAENPIHEHRRPTWRPWFVERPITPKELPAFLRALTKRKS